jgi:hypothetical protein
VTSLSRYSSCPLQVHSTAAKRVIRYFSSMAHYRLRYRPSSGTNTLHAFTDSDWAGCKSTRKSFGGFLQFYGNDEMICSATSTAPISWSSKQQTMVALSTLESEFIACSNATREVIWLSSLLQSIIGDGPLTQTPVYMDNQGALKLAETGVPQSRTKHIDVKHIQCHDE